VAYIKYSYNKNYYPEMYVKPKILENNELSKECSFIVDNNEYNIGAVNIYIPANFGELKNIKYQQKNTPLSLVYDNGKIVSAILSGIDKSLFIADVNPENEEFQLAVNERFKNYTKLDIVEFLLKKTPDDLSVFRFSIDEIINIIALHIKYGIVPKELTDIYRININDDVSGYILVGNEVNKNTTYMFFMEKNSGLLYQINLSGFDKKDALCIANKIKGN
jgi:hypothetical protein